MNHRPRCLALAVALPLALAQLASAQAPTPGERWRSTMSMEAMGMKLPGMTSEVCAPKGAQEGPPAAADKDCQVSNERRTAKSFSFDMQCKDGMTGTMEMTQESPTKWSGKMVANTRDGQMTMRMASEKLPGECDASEMERRMNNMIAAGNAAQAKACMESARSGSADSFVGANANCKDKASIDVFCGNSKTMSGYSGLARRQRFATSGPGAGTVSASWRTVLADTGRLCGFSPETVRTQHCGVAQGKKEWQFFAEECPELAKPIAQRECAGRDFTNPVAPAYRDFCSAYAAAGRSAGVGGASAGGGSPGAAATGIVDANAPASGQDTSQSGTVEQAKPTDKAKEALQKGRDALRGIFGR